MSTPYEKSITTRLSEGILAKIDKDAKSQGSKRSEVIRRILKAHYDAAKPAAKLAKV